ncbi:MAG: hypothetical protein JWO46_1368 [Nocardioidaceae bacterium]|nr:hypothetical protein [Nocardioidaceae bacterium]
MDQPAIFAAATQIRLATADRLETLDGEQLATPSLCGEWRVRDVAGHLLAPLVTAVPVLFWHTARNGFDINRGNSSLARSVGSRPIAEVAAGIREHAGAELKVPFVGAHGPFTDLLVHNADMRVPLGQDWQPDVTWAVESLRFDARGAIGFTPKKRLAGLRVSATDAEATYGEGAELRGPAFSLLLALCGRRVGLESLTGPGRDVLRARLG